MSHATTTLALPDQSAPVPAAHTAPPGDLAIWVFILAELLVFAVFFVSYAFARTHNVALVPGRGDHRNGARWLAGGMLCGGGFLVVKLFEYAAKFGAGISLSTNA